MCPYLVVEAYSLFPSCITLTSANASFAFAVTDVVVVSASSCIALDAVVVSLARLAKVATITEIE